jgi:hypothetical protein
VIRFGACACFAAVLLCGCNVRVGTDPSSDWERGAVDAKAVVREQEVVLPAYPQASDLVEFVVATRGAHRYFIDARSLQMGADGVVRYALIIRTAGGAANTTYEGIRCKTYEKRTYAFGHPQGKWIAAKRSDWQQIEPGREQIQAVLFNDYLCPNRAIATREEALRALRSGVYRPLHRPME